MVKRKWLKENGCPWNTQIFALTAKNGNLNNMKWLKENGCPWNGYTFANAALHGNLNNMKWLKENNCICCEWTFARATKNGNLDNMKWLKENGCSRHVARIRRERELRSLSLLSLEYIYICECCTSRKFR